jgi:hypothetical protein
MARTAEVAARNVNKRELRSRGRRIDRDMMRLPEGKAAGIGSKLPDGPAAAII